MNQDEQAWRDSLGAIVREAWVRWAETQPDPKRSWLVPYAELAEADKEADRQIGEHVVRSLLASDPDVSPVIRRKREASTQRAEAETPAVLSTTTVTTDEEIALESEPRECWVYAERVNGAFMRPGYAGGWRCRNCGSAPGYDDLGAPRAHCYNCGAPQYAGKGGQFSPNTSLIRIHSTEMGCGFTILKYARGSQP